MGKFKVGDKVILRKPRVIEAWPGWCPTMNSDVGKELTIVFIGRGVNGGVFYRYIGRSGSRFAALEHWLEPAREYLFEETL